MPAGMTKLDRKTKIVRELSDEISKCAFPILWRKCRRELRKNNRQLRSKRLERAQKSAELSRTIAEPSNMGDLARKLANEAESGRRHLRPTASGCFRRRAVKSGIDFHRRKIARVKFQPFVCRPFLRIKSAAPFLEAPGASADSDFLLINKIQARRRITDFPMRQSCVQAGICQRISIPGQLD